MKRLIASAVVCASLLFSMSGTALAQLPPSANTMVIDRMSFGFSALEQDGARPTSNGVPSGAIKYAPLKLTKTVDAFSDDLQQAFVSGTVFDRVQVTLRSSAGTSYQAILTNVQVIGLKTKVAVPDAADPTSVVALEDVTFSFASITWSMPRGK
jgi:type VI protein secretion system component Hcp